jgi:hypothetical protein
MKTSSSVIKVLKKQQQSVINLPIPTFFSHFYYCTQIKRLSNECLAEHACTSPIAAHQVHLSWQERHEHLLHAETARHTVQGGATDVDIWKSNTNSNYIQVASFIKKNYNNTFWLNSSANLTTQTRLLFTYPGPITYRGPQLICQDTHLTARNYWEAKGSKHKSVWPRFCLSASLLTYCK